MKSCSADSCAGERSWWSETRLSKFVYKVFLFASRQVEVIKSTSVNFLQTKQCLQVWRKSKTFWFSSSQDLRHSKHHRKEERFNYNFQPLSCCEISLAHKSRSTERAFKILHRLRNVSHLPETTFIAYFCYQFIWDYCAIHLDPLRAKLLDLRNSWGFLFLSVLINIMGNKSNLEFIDLRREIMQLWTEFVLNFRMVQKLPKCYMEYSLRVLEFTQHPVISFGAAQIHLIKLSCYVSSTCFKSSCLQTILTLQFHASNAFLLKMQIWNSEIMKMQAFFGDMWLFCLGLLSAILQDEVFLVLLKEISAF